MKFEEIISELGDSLKGINQTGMQRSKIVKHKKINKQTNHIIYLI